MSGKILFSGLSLPPSTIWLTEGEIFSNKNLQGKNDGRIVGFQSAKLMSNPLARRAALTA